MQNLKIDATQSLSFLGTGLSIIAMVISSIAQKKSMNEAVAKEVAEALNQKGSRET